MDTILQYLKELINRGGSDLHLIVGIKPFIRIKGDLKPIENAIILSNDTLQNNLLSLLEKENTLFLKKFKIDKEIDFSFQIDTGDRFRINYCYEQNNISATFRHIKNKIPSFKELELNPLFKDIINNNAGLILVTGPTGVGKTTTIASMINEINNTDSKRIVTIEDPIEYRYTSNKSIITQRAVGIDTNSFEQGLKHVLRQDPDIILIGEIRDKVSAEIALQAANTGHLVLSTLHTINSFDTINRIMDFFPFEESKKIKSLLSSVLISIISQQLINKRDNKRIAVQEVLINNSEIKGMILKDKLEDIYPYMQSSELHKGFTLNSELVRLINDYQIQKEDAIKISYNKEELKKIL